MLQRLAAVELAASDSPCRRRQTNTKHPELLQGRTLEVAGGTAGVGEPCMCIWSKLEPRWTVGVGEPLTTSLARPTLAESCC